MTEQLSSPGLETMVVLVLAILMVWLVSFLWSKSERFFRSLIRRKRSDERRDAVRTFTKAQRELGMSQCANRCEGTGVFFRCRYRGQDLHGDHWFPHSRGGATSVKNLVMLCPQCNMRKSAKIPSLAQTFALKLRRKIGFDYESPLSKVGEWLPRSYRREIPVPQNAPSAAQKLWDFLI